MRLLGQNASMGVVMMVLALLLGGHPVAPATLPAFMRGLHVIFWIFSALGVLGIFASLVRGRVR